MNIQGWYGAREWQKQLFASITALALILSNGAGFFALPQMANAAPAEDAYVIIDSVNGEDPSDHCVAGEVTIVGHGITGKQGGQYYLEIGWGDGSATTTLSADEDLTSGTLANGPSEKNNPFTFSLTHTPIDVSTGITVFLHHSTDTGEDSNVQVINQCVAPPDTAVITITKTVSGGSAVAGDFTLHLKDDTDNDVDSSANGGATSPFSGSTDGVDFIVPAGDYTISEDAAADYTASFGGDIACLSDGSITVVAGENYICSVTNIYDPVITYSVTYDGNTNDGGTAPVDGSSPYDYNSEVTVLGNTGSLTKTGYTFDGWNTASDGSGTDYAGGDTFNISADTTLYAQWSINSYAVTYDGNTNDGGTAPVDGNSPYNFDSTVTVLGLGDLIKTGYSFLHWNTASDDTGSSYAEGDTFSMPASAVTLYAIWSALPTYTVSYDGNGNDGGSAPTDGNSYLSGATVSVAGNTGSLTLTGYTFGGWNTAADGSGTDYSASDTFSMPGSDVTLYAQWVIDTYSVTYDGNTNDGGTAPVDGNSPYDYNSEVTVLGNTGSLTKTGYTFDGWNTASDGSGTDYAGGDTFNISADTTLYAQWSINSYAVTYDGNTNDGGTAPVDGNSPYNFDSTVTVLGEGDLTKSVAYAFTGWNTEADGSGTDYSEGDTFSMPASDVTLYAQWTPPTDADLSIEKDVDVQEPVEGTTIVYTITVTNNGPADATNVEVTDVIPAGLTYESDDSSDAYNDGTGVWTVGDLANGDVATIEITVSVDEDTAGQDIVNSASVTSDTTDPNDANDDADAPTVTPSNQPLPKLTIVKNTEDYDGTFTFNIEGANNFSDSTSVDTDGNVGTSTTILLGDKEATYNVTEDVSNEDWALLSASCVLVGSDGVFGNSYQNGFEFTVNNGDEVMCTFVNETSCDDTERYDEEAGQCVPKYGEAYFDLELTKEVEHDGTPVVGETVTYTISLSHSGDTTGNIVVADNLPSGVEYVSHTASNGDDTYSTTTGKWNIVSLTGGTATLEIVATIIEEGTIENTASIESYQGNDEDLENNTDSASFETYVEPPTPPSGGGGPIFGGGPIGGGVVLGASTGGQVLGETCGLYMDQYLRRGYSKNDLGQVTKLQQFLNKHGFGTVPTTGNFEESTENAVKAFQGAYANEILIPWGITEPTGIAYLTTIRQINLIECPDLVLQIPNLIAWSQNPALGGAVSGYAQSDTAGDAGVTTPDATAQDNTTDEGGEDNSDQAASVGGAVSGEGESPVKGGFWKRLWNWVFSN